MTKNMVLANFYGQMGESTSEIGKMASSMDEVSIFCQTVHPKSVSGSRAKI